MKTILKAENISKQYRLGTVGTGTISHDLNRWWYKVRGKEDPYLKIGAVNDRSSKATNDYVWALKDINFEVKQGEVLGIIGKNGAGKSTLLKILSRVTSPTTGVIKTKGRIASLLEVGTGFHPELTGRENIFLNGAVLGMTRSEIKDKLDEIIAFSGCEMYIDTPVKRYSSGMTVRLAFAVAAHLEPDILVVDEVLAVGDAEFQKKAIGKMQDISKGEGRTVLFVSHNMASVKNLCTRGILLENGSISFLGKIDECIESYLKSSVLGIHKKPKHNRVSEAVIKLEYKFIYKNEILNLGNSIMLGDKLKIILKIYLLDFVRGLSIALDIKNASDELFCHIINEDDNFYFSFNGSSKELIIEIETDPITFIPNLYIVNLWIGVNQTETLYEIRDAFSFYVEQSTFTGRMKKLPKHAKLYLDSRWKLL